MSASLAIVRRRGLVAGALGVALILALVLAFGGDGEQRHTVYVEISDATNVIAGQYVRVAGVPVGEITSTTLAKGGRSVRLGIELEDRVWPLTAQSRLQLRWGGTVSYVNRYVNLVRGPATGRPIRDGGTLPARAFAPPVEFDELLRTFSPTVRRQLKGFVNRAGNTLDAAQAPVRRALRRNLGPAAAQAAGSILRDFDQTQAELKLLVRSGDRVVAALQSANPRVGDLVSGTAATFRVIAREASNVRASIDRAPGTFVTLRSSLGRAEASLRRVATLTTNLKPGVKETRRLAAPLSSALARIHEVAPNARATVATLRRATPDVKPFLARAEQELPRIASIATQADEALKCVRPFSPEIAGFFSNWTSFTGTDDGTNKVVRAQLQTNVYPTMTPLTSAELTKAIPSLKFVFPRPPGTDVAQPWFLPECGMTEKNFDPSQDPLAAKFDPSSKQLISTNKPAEPSK